MNCATHSDIAALAFCRTCGKPLCNNCTRDVRGVIYCEACLAARLDGTAPAAGFVPPQTGYQPVVNQGPGGRVSSTPTSAPNPAVAGILAGFFPFGVGAVYTGQYAKGLSHLGIIVLLLVGVSSDVPWYMHMILGISIGFFYVYQIIDAISTAKALQTGAPAPDPFGLAQMFSTGERSDTRNIPAGAVVLIGLGVLFLLHTMDVFEFGFNRFWPLILIFLGGWLFAKQWGLIGNTRGACGCARCRTCKLMGPAMLVTIGLLFLLQSLHIVDFDRTWPAILLVVGLVKLLKSNASSEGHVGPLFPVMPPSSAPPPPASPDIQAPPSSGEINHV